ncbi:CheY-like chemotaxis protein [Paraburkholderia sp. GAS199]|uniref:response regulator n=1 Tax=Paraburkholderia sp. GAS199 TaxID=3035126 RepID=UPI003D200D9D
MTLVLLVDDDADLREVLEFIVTGDGYRVHTAADGQHAMLEIVRERPDIIVSDVMMPRMDGPGMVCALLAIPALSDIPVVLMSAAAPEPGLPIHMFLAKPFEPTQLLEVLHSVQLP